MSTFSKVSEPSQEIILFQPCIPPKTFVQREIDTITKKVFAHVMELALTQAHALSCDLIPNRSVLETIGVIRKLDLRQDQRFGIAKRSLEINPIETVPNIEPFCLSQDQRFDLTKNFLELQLCSRVSFLHFFNLTPNRLFDAAARCAVQDPLTARFGKVFGRLSLERRYIIAKLCAENEPDFTAANIQNFDLPQDLRFEVAKVCAKTEGIDADIDDDLEGLALTPEQELEIKKLCAFPLDFSSVQQCIGQDVNQVMVYGFSHAKYRQIATALEKLESPGLRVFDSTFGDPIDPKSCVTSEGGAIEDFPPEPEMPQLTVQSTKWDQDTARRCKAAVTNLVLQNFKRQKLCLPLIPLIFCIEAPDTPEKHKLTVHSLSTKESGINSLITHSELRRVYKLCKELEHNSDPLAHALAHVAQETLKLVRLEHREDLGEALVMTNVVPVWEHPDWKEAWANRVQQKSPEAHQQEQQAKKYYWKDLLLARAKLC